MAVLSSNFGGRFINELRAYAQTDQRHSDPFLLVPAARVQVNSDLTDARSITTLAFGGNAGLPQRSLTRSLDISNELSWLEGNGAHRIKLGALFSGSRFSQDVTSNRLGTYTFNSLEDLADNQPSIFTRTLSPAIRTGTSLNSALYLGDTWRRYSRPRNSRCWLLTRSSTGVIPLLCASWPDCRAGVRRPRSAPCTSRP